MKKIVNVKEIMIILISVVLITFLTTNVYGLDVLGDNNPQPVSPNEYENAQTPTVDNTANNNTNNNVNNSNTNNNNVKNNSTNNTKVYNTNNNTDLPQTGIEDYNIGILMVICVASAVIAYRKINDYKNI